MFQGNRQVPAAPGETGKGHIRRRRLRVEAQGRLGGGQRAIAVDVLGADDLVIKIEEFREATDWRVPISLKIGAGRLKDDIKIALKDKVDFVAIDGMQGRSDRLRGRSLLNKR